jgi:crotonobetainyl-CoA:carnitine CoA-transferase CaiB-like acyl-CoA transferase
MPGPLQGVRVLDLSVMISGPLATMILADQGAEVIKVESPGLGDIMRFLGTSRGGMTGIFANNNRGKRSLVLDLKQPAGVDVLTRLVAESDVFIQNFRPGAVDRLGLGYEAMAAVNPRLVYVSISGYGQTGPNSHRRVYDNVIQAASGFAAVQADTATGVPSLLRTLVCDKVTAWTTAQAITAALLARERGAVEGQHLDIAMLDSSIAFLWPDAAMDKALLAEDAHRAPTIAQNYAVTPLADGYCSGAAVTDAEFRGWCTALGHPEVADDPRFATVVNRLTNATEMVGVLKGYALETTLEDFLRLAGEHDVPASAINSVDSLPDDPQVRHNEVFIEREHPVAGPMREPRPAARFSSTPQQAGAPAPTYGEHSDEIVTALGLDAAGLRAAGVIA